MRQIVNISLPEELNKQLEAMVKEGNYASKSEFIRDLLRVRLDQQILRDVRQSEREIKAGKGKIIKSLRELR